MPDDERTRRRLGDATKNRIADLASGWSVGEEEPEPPPETRPAPRIELTPDPEIPASAPRQRRKTEPPPPPGSAARKQLEDAIIDAVTPTPVPRSNPPAPPRSNPPAAPRSNPPAVPPRTHAPTKPPAIPAAAKKPNAPYGALAGPTETGTVSLAGAIGGTAPLEKPTVDAADTERNPPPTPAHIAALAAARAEYDDKPTVPRGEFEIGGSGGTEVEKEKLRIAYEQSTLKRDAASALLSIPEQPETVVRPQPVEVLLHETAVVLRGDPTSIDAPSTTKFERGDPTALGSDPTLASTGPPDMRGGTLRSQAALKRKRGLGGDVRYVLTVLFGVRKARQELGALETKQALRQQSRKRHLVTLGRAAATLDGFDHPALGPACETLVKVEDERAQHSAAVSAADGELARVRSGREAKSKEHAEELKQLDAELVDITKKLEPLEKEVSTIGKRAGDLRDALRKLDQRIANTEMRVHTPGPKHDLAAIQAEIATLKADRVAVSRDEPKLASELDALNPRIAALESRRGEAKRRRTEIEAAEREDQKRCDDLLAAIGAKRKVVDRAAIDAETLRDKVLFDLGERLYVDRALDLGPQLAPIDVIDVELGTGDRRSMELKEILSSVDKAKLARGIGVLVLVFGALLALALLFSGAI